MVARAGHPSSRPEFPSTWIASIGSAGLATDPQKIARSPVSSTLPRDAARPSRSPVPQTPVVSRSMAEWLDRPVQWLRSHRSSLQPTFVACVVLTLLLTAAGQLLSGLSGDPASLATMDVLPLLGMAMSMGLAVFALTTLVELVACAGLVAVDNGQPSTMKAVLARALAVPMVTAALTRGAIHALMAVTTIFTCGLGIFLWLVVVMYLPLVLPVAAREQVGGVNAHLRSMSLLSWTPRHGPWYGSVDRVVVALHVIAGLAYALWALPNLPTIAWMIWTVGEKLGTGQLDPATLQAELAPPIWLGLPVQVVSALVGLATTFYSQRLFLDLHTDLLDAREGRALHRALDHLGVPRTDG